jgi:hypothetical protein
VFVLRCGGIVSLWGSVKTSATSVWCRHFISFLFFSLFHQMWERGLFRSINHFEFSMNLPSLSFNRLRVSALRHHGYEDWGTMIDWV